MSFLFSARPRAGHNICGSKSLTMTGAVATVASALVLSGCTIGDPAPLDSTSSESATGPTLPEAESRESSSISPTLPASSTQDSSKAADAQAALDAAVSAAVTRFGGQAGIAVADGQGVIAAGQTGPAAAWSTSKVPLAIAAHRARVADPATISSAITFSDNQAAEQMWQALGAGEEAAAAVGSVLAEAGNGSTRVQPQVTRPGFSAFGQTQWSVSDQARFASRLGCLDGADQVLSAMQVSDPAQGYGLRQFVGARMKGGWGPDESGAYEVRQLGIVSLEGTPVALALFAHPQEGTYEAGQAMLSTMTEELKAAQVTWPSAACS